MDWDKIFKDLTGIDPDKFVDPLNYPFDVDKVMDKLGSIVGSRYHFQYYYLPQFLQKNDYDLNKEEDIQRLKHYLQLKELLKDHQYRYKFQGAQFTERKIQDWMVKNIHSLHTDFKGFELVQEEYPLNDGHIDLLLHDPDTRTHIGIEIKRTASKRNLAQFERYYNDLKSAFGNNTRMIVLSNLYTLPLLEENLDKYELWKYEINTGFKKQKKANKIFIKSIKAAPSEEAYQLSKLI